jgi:hypothetical protein
MPGEIIENETIVELGTDEVANVLSFLPLRKIMCLRRVNMTWREAAKETIVPTSNDSYFSVESVKEYNAMTVMTTELPNLQQIKLCQMENFFVYGHKYSDGEDPDKETAYETSCLTSHDIEIMSRFSKLRILELYGGLNGRYPALFNFPLLQKLSIRYCPNIKWDLGMLAGLPLLKELDCKDNLRLTGNINSLRVLKGSLEKVDLPGCHSVEGNFMDLVDFPHLKELDLLFTSVIGDIRDVGENDFTSLERLHLPHGVYGGHGYELQRISDGPDLMRTLYLFKKQRPALKMEAEDWDWYCRLSDDSPDRYDSVEEDDTPPFDVTFVKAGSHIGYRWESDCGNPCEVNWLDLEPDRDSSDYKEYIEELQQKQQVNQYRGFHQPPTEEEYKSIWERNAEDE